MAGYSQDVHDYFMIPTVGGRCDNHRYNHVTMDRPLDTSHVLADRSVAPLLLASGSFDTYVAVSAVSQSSAEDVSDSNAFKAHLV